MQELTDRRVDFRALACQGLWQELERVLHIGQEVDALQRIAMLETCLLRQLLTRTSVAIDLLDQSVNEIERHRGQIRIDMLARELGVSRRDLERRFLHAVGISPKAFSRIVRFEHACREARRLAWRDWSRVAAECAILISPIWYATSSILPACRRAISWRGSRRSIRLFFTTTD